MILRKQFAGHFLCCIKWFYSSVIIPLWLSNCYAIGEIFIPSLKEIYRVFKVARNKCPFYRNVTQLVAIVFWFFRVYTVRHLNKQSYKRDLLAVFCPRQYVLLNQVQVTLSCNYFSIWAVKKAVTKSDDMHTWN